MRGKALKLDSSGGAMIKALEKGAEDGIMPSNVEKELGFNGTSLSNRSIRVVVSRLELT
jgi:hypothetical protein|tara:strand:- start:789 stop:965 length:177 start_codon:yes stop_codon:yes gene_type:complete